MARITLIHNTYDPAASEQIEWTGSVLDFLEDRFPNGKPVLTVDLTTGEALPNADWLVPLSDDADIAIAPAHGPAGGDFFTIGLIVLATILVSVALSFALMPTVDAFDEDAPESVYSVSVKANQPKLGAIVPIQYGTFSRTPEYASQPYRRFENNNEKRFYLLSLGAGDMSVEEVFIGDTAVSDLSANVASYDVYTSSQHNKAFGDIETGSGIYENVSTSGDVDQIEIIGREKYRDDVVITASSGTSRIETDDEILLGIVDVGDDLIIAESNDMNGTYTVADVGADYIDVEETFTGNASAVEVEIGVRSTATNYSNYYVTNKAGFTTQKIEIDIEWPRGLFTTNDKGRLRDASVTLVFDVQEIDDAGNDVGSPSTSTVVVTEGTDTHIRRTYEIDVSAGRYKVRVGRSDGAEVSARDSDATRWTGLKAYLDDDGGTRYGNVTILALEVSAAQELSSSSQQRIRVKASRSINQLGTSTPDTSGNLADVFADIITNSDYGAAGSSAEYDATGLAAFRTAQSSRSGFNGVFDKQTTVWKALSSVLFLGRSKPYPKGFSIGLVTDEVKSTRSTIITPDNMIEGSLKSSYEWLEPGASDGVEIEYRTQADENPVYTRFPTDSLNPDRRFVIGLTDDDEAESAAKYLWRQRTLRTQTVEWAMELDGENLTPYERVSVAVPQFDWGKAGYVVSADGTTIVLSQAMPADTLSVIFRKQDGSVTDAVSATGDGTNTIVLSASPPIDLIYDGSSVPTLCAIGNLIDVTILSIYAGDNRTRVTASNYDASIFTGLV